MDFDEFRYTMTLFTVTDVMVVLAAYDLNEDGSLDRGYADELDEFYEFVEEVVEARGVNFNDLEETWINAQGLTFMT